MGFEPYVKVNPGVKSGQRRQGRWERLTPCCADEDEIEADSADNVADEPFDDPPHLGEELGSSRNEA